MGELLSMSDFLRKIVRERVPTPPHFVNKPVVCVDESVNAADVWLAIEELVRADVIAYAAQLWTDLRQKQDRSLRYVAKPNHPRVVHRNAVGAAKVRKRPFPDRLLPPRSYPDRMVVQGAVAMLGVSERVVLLSADRGTDGEGLPTILRQEVRPVLDTLHDDRLSFLVLFKDRHRLSTHRDYAKALGLKLRTHQFVPGYAEETLSTR
jgi:hypothetical protein